MLRWTPFRPGDLLALDGTDAERLHRAQMYDRGEADGFCVDERAWTGWEDGQRIVCIGLLPQWQGRVVAWAFFGKPSHIGWFLAIRRFDWFMKKVMTEGVRRIEATVPQNFGPGCRMLQLLKFEVEGPLKNYGPDGADHFMFARTA